MKIVVVGGGTAGWLAALMISKITPEHSVTVVESSAIGIVGAGEGSTGLLTSILQNTMWDFDCDLLEFFQETGATLKYGIKHKNWTPDLGTHYMGPIGGTASTDIIADYIFAHYHGADPANAYRGTVHGQAIDRNVSNFNKTTLKFDMLDTALHFDASKVGKYFKKLTTKNNKVTHIDDEILDATLTESGYIKSLLLKSGASVDGDFFIDASGFRQVLVKKLGVKWVSYKKNLPVNSAMPFFLQYKEDECPELWTTAWAQSSGWMWQIPVQERKGCGYVFDDNFITAEQAQAEIETTLGHPIEPIRVLKFDTGRVENVWERNCLSIGLAAAFAEPLEATSIHTTVAQLLTFIFEFLQPTLEDTMNPGSVKSYNQRTAKLYDTTKEFLVAHYMGGRTDTEFWRWISSGATRTEFVDTILTMSKTKMPTNRDLDLCFGAPDMGLWGYVLAGTGNLLPSVSGKMFSNNSVPMIGLHDVAGTIAQYEKSVNDILAPGLPYKDFIKYIKRTAK